MKFVMAVVVQILLGLILMVGMIQAVHGSYWLLMTGFLAYLVLLTRYGCASH